MTSKEHKIIAKEALTGNWGLAIGILAVSLLLPLAISIIPLIGLIIILVFSPALAYVPLQLFLRIKRKEEVHIEDFFRSTFNKNLGKFWIISLYVGLIIIGIGLISFLLAGLISRPFFNISQLIGNIISIILTVLAYVIIYYFSFRYSQVAYIMYDYPELSCREIAKKSSDLMKGNIIKLLCLYLSFLGWVILSTLTFGIAYLYTLPYLYTALASFYDSIADHSNEETKVTDNPIIEE